MKIIGISGKKNTGKNTLADMISTMCGDTGIVQLAFADCLKDEVCKEFQITRKFLEDNKDMFRPMLQAWGELKRKIFGEDYWVDRLFSKITRLSPDVKLVMITDVRYTDEANRLKKYPHCLLFRTQRYVPFLSLDKHSSEVDLDDYDKWDEMIENNDSMQHLLEKVSEIVRRHKLN